MSCPPEQQTVMKIDQIVLHENLVRFEAKRRKLLPEDALRAVHHPRIKTPTSTFIHRVGEDFRQTSHFVFLISDESYLLGPGSDGMIALPDYMSFNDKFRQRHLAIRI